MPSREGESPGSNHKKPANSGGVPMQTNWVQELIVGILRTLAFGYDILAYLPYRLIYKPYHARMMSASIKARRTDEDDINAPYRCVDAMDKLVTTLDDRCSTLDELFEVSVSRHAKRRCLGWREIYSEEDEVQARSGRVFKKLVLGDYHWLNYMEVNDMCEQFGAGLQTIGQRPRHNLVIFADTCYQWMVAVQAAFKYTFPVVTVYATLGEEGIVHSVNESEATHIVTTAQLLNKMQGFLSKLPHVTHIVYIESQQYVGAQKVSAPPSVLADRVKVSSMTDIIKAGEQILSSEKHKLKCRPEADDTAVIMYTSGSTGVPKGVVISHRNLMAGMAGQAARIPNLGPSDTYIGYLPLAHVLELGAELSCMAHGTKIGYSSALTLTDNASKVKRGCSGDATILKPTLMAAVPVIMDRIYKTVWEKVNEGNACAKALFRFAYERKKKSIEAGLDSPILNRLIFQKTRQILGGHIRLMLSGGAPLADDTQRFMNICLCCPVGQGYGLTETCGAGTITDVSDLSTGRVGAPLPCCEVRLVEWVEGGYSTRDRPYPRGEILVGGDNVTRGYYKMEAKTSEDYYTDPAGGRRWFMTGDIGQVEEDGVLRIIDRKKDLVKLQTGEYISLGRVESLLKTCSLIDEICLYGESDKMFIVALVVPNHKQLRGIAAKLDKIPSPTDNDVPIGKLITDREVVSEALRLIQEHGKKVKLEKLEIPQRLTLCPDAWTPDSGLVTEAFKLKRKPIMIKYEASIRRMYS